jgi:hypothetical protein
MVKFVIAVILVLASHSFAQEKPELVDEFGPLTNDDLLARVDNFQAPVKGWRRIAVLHGPPLAKYINQRRIEGCNLMRRYSQASISFVFDKITGPISVEFWRVPVGVDLPNFSPTVPDYTLDDLHSPFELSSSGATDDFCPRHFDLDWYSLFMRQIPRFLVKSL